MKVIRKCLLLFFISVLGLSQVQNTFAQCNSAIAVDDSIALLELYSNLDGANWFNNSGWTSSDPVRDWFGVTVSDVSGVCRVTALYLSSNNLSGSLDPNMNLTALDSLDLQWNNIVGSIPDFINLPSLRTIRFAYCQFSGNLPDFSNLPNLEHIELRSNQVSGPIPDFSNLPSLKFFNVPENDLNGSIPDFSNIPTLELLGLEDNPLTGTLPDFSNLPNLEVLAIEKTSVGGSLPNFTNLASLTGLFIHESEIDGTIPDFTNLPNLENLWAYDTNLEGIIPDFTNLPELIDLQVCDNNFWGPKPSLDNCPLLDPTSIDFACSYCSLINGIVYDDVNANCIYDSGEPLISDAELVLNGGAQVSFSDQNGYYEFLAPSGINEVIVLLPETLWSIDCDISFTVDLTDCTAPATSHNFGMTVSEACPLPTVKVSSSGLIACEQSIFLIDYCNEGTESIENAYIIVDLEPELSIVGSDSPFSIVGTKYQFDIGALPDGICDQISFTVLVECTVPIGSTGCIEAEIFPRSDCSYVEGPNWDGSDLELNAECINDSVIFRIRNLGEDMSDTSSYKIYTEDVLIFAIPFNLASGEELQYIHVNTAANAIRMEVEQRPDHPSLDNLRTVVELCGQTPYSLGYVTSTPLYDLDPHRDLECNIIGTTIDANQKTVQPTGVGLSKLISPETKLEYKVIFENELSYPAHHVYIVDTIDSDHLDIYSVTVEASSHPYQMYIFDESIIAFVFDDLVLLDQSSAFSEKSGYIIYSLEQKDVNAYGDIIQSDAAVTIAYNQKSVSSDTYNSLGGLPESCNSYSLVQAAECTSAIVNGEEYTIDGNYIQMLTNADGCDSLISIIVDIESINANVSFESSGTLQAESENGFYSWINCDTEMTIAGEISQTFTPVESGNYALIIDNGVCTEMSECQYISISAIEDFSSAIRVYPTAVESVVNIEYSLELEVQEVNIYNSSGQSLIRSFEHEKTIDMSLLSSGIYFLHMSLEGENTHIVKVLKR